MNTFDMSKKPIPPNAVSSHDSDAPPNLLAFMLKSWKASSGKPPAPIRNVGCFKKRRDALSGLFPDELILIPTGHLKVRANDTHYTFRASSDFFYLTGNQEPDCVLVLLPEGSKGHRQLLFVEPNPGKTDATFFTDRLKGELWEGARLGVPESQARYGIECRALSELEAFVAESTARAPKGVRIRRGDSEKLEQWLKLDCEEQKTRDKQLATALSEMRLLKDAEEVREISAAVRSTHRGFEDVIRRLKTAKSERELEGVLYTRARIEGNDVGYASIVASGAHACTLHWKKNDGRIRKGDLLLLDAGIEGNSLYTADVTRTLPIAASSPASSGRSTSLCSRRNPRR